MSSYNLTSTGSYTIDNYVYNSGPDFIDTSSIIPGTNNISLGSSSITITTTGTGNTALGVMSFPSAPVYYMEYTITTSPWGDDIEQTNKHGIPLSLINQINEELNG